jgi:hypothetical protein
MSLTLRPILVTVGAKEEKGMLVFDQKMQLLAVLTYVPPENEAAPGHWYLEGGFGPLHDPSRPTFADLDAAQQWINKRLGHRE